MKKLTVLKTVLGLVIVAGVSTYVHTTSEKPTQDEEQHSSLVEKEAESEDVEAEKAKETNEVEEGEVTEAAEEPAKPVRTKFGFEKLPMGTQQPWRLVRGLQRLQDDIVRGKPRAQDAYALLLGHLAKLMDNLDNSVWEHERNIDALTVYLLLGGSTELGYKALQKTKLDDLQKQPLEAALAFAERDLEKAYELLLEIDHQALPPSMSAQFALAKSMVVSSTSLDLASIYLREARRLAPGTLIEEGAIRRSIRIAGETKAKADLFRLSRSYLRRFKKSHYFNDFLRNFGFALVRMPKQNENELLKFLKEVLAQVDDTQKIAVAAYVARHATVSGQKKMSSWASNMALEKLQEGSVIYDRMQLYSASTAIVNKEESLSAMKTLEAISFEKFDRTDQQIFSAAQVLGKQILQDSIRGVPEKNMPEESGQMATDEAEQDQNVDVLKNQYVQRANELLKSSQGALEGMTQ